MNGLIDWRPGRELEITERQQIQEGKQMFSDEGLLRAINIQLLMCTWKENKHNSNH